MALEFIQMITRLLTVYPQFRSLKPTIGIFGICLSVFGIFQYSNYRSRYRYRYFKILRCRFGFSVYLPITSRSLPIGGLWNTSWYPSARMALGYQLALWYSTCNRRPSCCGQQRRHASSAIAMFPGLSHSSLAYWSSRSATAVNSSRMLSRWLCSLLSVAWHRHRRIAPSRTCTSPKAAVAYVCWGGGKCRVPCASSFSLWI